VTVGGVVGAVGPLLAGDDPATWHLAVLVPESLITAGDLDIAVHLVTDDDTPLLTPVELS